MPTYYVFVKFFHILIAILALGTSAGLGIVLELYGANPEHGPYVLRMIKRILAFFVIPGYALMLLTGLWMVNLSWPLTTKWIQLALVLWAVGLVILGLSLAAVQKQWRLSDKPSSTAYRRIASLGRALGAGVGLVVVAMLYLMVFKPWS
jgi:uncharacterized membrane protein